MGSDVTIRPAHLGHARRIQTFVKAEAEGLGIPDEYAYARADEFLAAAGRSYDLFLIAERGRALLGFAILTTGVKHSNEHTASLRIHMSEAARGAGVGSALLERALEWADERGIVRVTATPYLPKGFSHAESHPKMAFFTRHGFVLEGIGRKAARNAAGELVDIALMARVV